MLKILIADDDKIIRGGLKAIIERSIPDSCIVGEAYNGIVALDIINSTPVDILIADIKMPGMNGVELVKALKAMKSTIKIIILSGFEEYRYVRETLRNGASDYLLKPVENEVLINLINKLRTDITEELESIEKYKSLEHRVSSGISALKEKYLLALINGSNATYFPRIKEELNIDNNCDFLLSVICIDDYYKLIKENSPLLNFNLNSVIEGCIRKLTLDRSVIKEYFLVYKDLEIILLFISNKGDTNYFNKSVFSFLEEVNNIIATTNEFTVTIGISENYKNLEETNRAYEEALIAEEQRFFKSKNILVKYDKAYISFDDSVKLDFDSQISSLFNYIELTEIEKILRVIEDIFNKLSKEKISHSLYRETIKSIYIKLNLLSQEFKDAAEQINELDYDFDFKYFIDEINTLSELKEYTRKSFISICKKINYLRSHRSKKTIQMVKEYIKDHFKEEISLKSAAEHVYMNYTYLSELFKIETGKNFSDYIIETRIEEAKKLLKNSNIKAYEVGHMVGYEEPTSFNRIFKKIVGLSPSEYRKVIK
ncbi:MAG TPA: response regulator [Clostridiaceae bacterium]